MATFVLVHGAGDVGWYWHLVEAELRARGHDTVAPDLPCDDAAGLPEYADAVAAAIGGRTDLVVVAQSLGAFTAPLVCDRVAVELLVLVAPMIPAPAEAPADYWANTRYEDEERVGYDDTVELFYQDVPPELVAEARRRGRAQSEARMGEPSPLRAWPDVPTRVLICRDDRLFPTGYLRRVARERLGITPDEMDGGHTPALSRPRDLADRLEAYAAEEGLLGGVRHSGYDAELRRYDRALLKAWDLQADDHVLDIGCGAGWTTRQAARMARSGSALGVDVSAAAIERAREIARTEGPGNVAFEHADAQTHRFPPERFDLAISRFGTMFFEDPVAAFANIGRALRPAGRLVMMVWQSSERNEWDVALRRALEEGGAAQAAAASTGPDPFSLADPPAVTRILEAAGFADVAFTDVHEPVYYGPDVAAALEWVRGFTSTSEALDRLAPAAAARAVGRLRETLTAHLGDDGVWFDSRAWIVTARRRREEPARAGRRGG
ncbi:alpha/beta fold hydrolase [Actinomadura opuntiae]|uniref:alpha/beta fold hydrolase n=1 Tax=Actinomadura sp. OS1-43 TaxID=604315 RepID=UPI00255ACDBC|nr:alpha/beta fold hydrolase [Actinomadura sp. OS1-43]MDL4816476.1 alpha/beta fold hydrolase [Actinomadura sp. OS1-43]